MFRVDMAKQDSMSAQPDNVAKTAGRGFLVITAAKLWFMVGGSLITFGLPYIFSRGGANGRALYGQYIDLNNTLSIFSMVMVTGVMQTVSKFVSERPENAPGIVRQAGRLMFVIGTLVAAGFIIGAPYIADARNNPGLVNGYRLAGLIPFFYAIYTVYIGTLNGRKEFFRQALYDIGFTTIKATLVLGLALAGMGVIGAFGGFAIAAGVIMVVAVWRVGRTARGEGVPAEALYAFALQVMLYTLVFNVVFKLDVLMLKPAAVELFVPAAEWLPDGAVLGAIKQSAIEASVDGLMGVYGIALQIARLPWQATIAITFIVFPLVSEATFSQDRERARAYVRQTMRYSMLLVGLAAVVLAAVPQAIVGLLPPGFADAAVVLGWLAPAYFFFSLFNIVNTVLMSAGKAHQALLIGVVTCGIAAGAYMLLLGGGAHGPELMAQTGLATLIAFVIGLCLGLAALWRLFGPPLPLATVLRVGLIGTALVIAGRQLPAMGRIANLAVAGGVAVAFIALLVISREFGAEDKARFMKILRRGG